MKKIAYIISAFTDPKQLERLVVRLSENSDFYIHIDKKVDITPFKQLLGKNVHFVRRHWISWGGWSQVKYQQEMLRAVLDSGIDYSHVVCLSGLDYPLWNTNDINTFFNSNPTKEFISGYNLTTNKFQLPYIRNYHLFRDLECSNTWIKNKLIVASRNILKYILHKQTKVEINGRLCDVYKGSDYWAITLQCAKYVYSTIKQKKLQIYFKTSYIPSEMCIQTIVFNSPFAKDAMLWNDSKYPGLHTLTPLHFIDYTKQIKILDTSDYQRLKESGRMFCRKVISGKSDELVSIIDNPLKHNVHNIVNNVDKISNDYYKTDTIKGSV